MPPLWGIKDLVTQKPMNCEIDIKQAVECLRKGGVILYPTDTVWGIGCDATNEEAVRRIYEIKQREDAKSMLCLVDKADRIQRYFRNIPDVAWDIFDAADSPVTVILDGAEGVAPSLIAEDGSLGMRVTRDQFSHDSGKHQRQHKRRTHRTHLPRNQRGDKVAGGLYLFLPPRRQHTRNSQPNHKVGTGL